MCDEGVISGISVQHVVTRDCDQSIIATGSVDSLAGSRCRQNVIIIRCSGQRPRGDIGGCCSIRKAGRWCRGIGIQQLVNGVGSVVEAYRFNTSQQVSPAGSADFHDSTESEILNLKIGSITLQIQGHVFAVAAIQNVVASNRNQQVVTIPAA